MINDHPTDGKTEAYSSRNALGLSLLSGDATKQFEEALLVAVFYTLPIVLNPYLYGFNTHITGTKKLDRHADFAISIRESQRVLQNVEENLLHAPLSCFDVVVPLFFEFQIFDVVLDCFHLNFVLQHVAYFINGVSDIKNTNFLVKFHGVVLQCGEIFSIMVPVFNKSVGVLAFPLDLSHSLRYSIQLQLQIDRPDLIRRP